MSLKLHVRRCIRDTVIVADHSREKGVQGLVTPVSKSYLSQMSIYLTELLYFSHSLDQYLLHLQCARRRANRVVEEREKTLGACVCV